MMQLRPYQREAVDAVYDYLRKHDDNPCVVLPTGCHAKGHPILMFDGTIKKVEDIVVGDLLMGADSTPRRVLQLARGREPMIKVVPNKGEPFVVNQSHILSLVSTNEGKGRYQCYQRGGEIVNISIVDYMHKSRFWKHLRKLYRVPVDFFCSNCLTIPPYILGLLLGDGSIIYGVSLCSADAELGEIFSKYAVSRGCYVRVGSNKNDCLTYHASVQLGKSNPIAADLRALGLWGHSAGDKFIPQNYLTATRAERLQLLAGLCDTDGFINRQTIDYVTKSRQLAKDIVFLTRSLGFSTTIRRKHCVCQTGNGGWYYRIVISGDLSCIPFQRKKHTVVPRKQKKNVLRTGFTLQPMPEDNFYGFALDGDHLYVDGNFIVHHNTGKSVCLAQIASDAVLQWHSRVLLLAHVKELLEQNADKIRKLCPEIPVGLYSAGLKSRDTDNPVIVAGIQSVYNKACDLGAFDLVMVDECHLITTDADGEGMYRHMLADLKVINPAIRLVGFTATPFRMRGGLICQPENFLNAVCYEAGIKEMIQQGYLSPLISRAGKAEAQLDHLHIRAGEFIASEVESAMDKAEITEAACREIAALTQNRKSVLIFGSGIQHCQHIAECLQQLTGCECPVISGDTPALERQMLLERFKGKAVQKDLLGGVLPPLKFLCNMNVLTTGFDAPNVDCIVLLRPTASPGLLVQMCGRGTRLSPETGKTDCLVLDFGGNILRHGPIDCITVRSVTSDRKGQAPAKKCPECMALIHAAYSKCPECGYEFPVLAHSKLTTGASGEAILSGQTSYADYEVSHVDYSVHEKRGAGPDVPKTMQVDYEVGFYQKKSEWVCPEHSGYARAKFERWWSERAAVGCECPNTAEEAVRIAKMGLLAEPKKIVEKVVSGEKYGRICSWELGPRPTLREPGADEDEDFASNSPADLGVIKDELDAIPF